jgi:hypothetical protein
MTEQAVEQNPSATVPALQGSDIPLGWKPTRAAPVPVVRCTQTKKDGLRCKKWSLRGYDKCLKHAGPGALMKDGNVNKFTEAVIEAGRLRLVGDTDTAIDVLNDLMSTQSSEGIRLKAATEILDRAGVRGGFEVKVDQEITINPSTEVEKRLAKLKAGAEAVEKLKAEREAELRGDIVDAEIVDDDGQEVLF